MEVILETGKVCFVIILDKIDIYLFFISLPSSDYNMYYYFENATGNSQWEYPKSTQLSVHPSTITQPSVVSVSIPALPAIPAFPSSHVLALQTQQMMMTAVAPGYPGMMMSAALTTPIMAPAIPTILPMVQTFIPPLPTLETKKRPGNAHLY